MATSWPGAIIVRRSLFLQAGGFDVAFGDGLHATLDLSVRMHRTARPDSADAAFVLVRFVCAIAAHRPCGTDAGAATRTMRTDCAGPQLVPELTLLVAPEDISRPMTHAGALPQADNLAAMAGLRDTMTSMLAASRPYPLRVGTFGRS